MSITIITVPAGLKFSKNEILVSFSGDNQSSTFRLDLKKQNNVLIASLEGKLNFAGVLSFDLSEILDAYPDYYIAAINSVVHNQGVLFRYKFTITELSPGSEVLASYISEVLPVLKGGIAQGFLSDPFVWMKENKKFLTHAQTITILVNQHYFLDYLHLTELITDLSVKAKLMYTDGSSYTMVLQNHEQIEPGMILRINAGFNDNLMQLPFPLKTISHYIITVENTTQTFAAMLFEIDYAYYRNPVFFLYGNSLGGIDGAYLSGRSQVKLKPEMQLAERYIAAGKKVITFGHTITRELETATGYKSKKEIERLVEIFLTCFIFEIVNEALVPVIIDPSSSLMIDQSANLNAATIKYSRAAVNRTYTPDLFDVKN